MQIPGSSGPVRQSDFLKLLVTQLRHQDPLNPLDQQQQLAQLAQFSMVEGVEQLNQNFRDMLQLQLLGQGSQLLGKSVQYQSAATGETQTGVVTQLERTADSFVAVVQGQRIPFSQITHVLSAAS